MDLTIHVRCGILTLSEKKSLWIETIIETVRKAGGTERTFCPSCIQRPLVINHIILAVP